MTLMRLITIKYFNRLTALVYICSAWPILVALVILDACTGNTPNKSLLMRLDTTPRSKTVRRCEGPKTFPEQLER